MMPRGAATHFSELLLFVLAALEEHQIEYILQFGTLLGAARLGGPLPWDDDHDVYVIDAQPQQLRAWLQPLLEEHGFRLSWDERGFFWVRERLWAADSGHLALHFLPPLVSNSQPLPVWEGGAPDLWESELRPLQRLPYYSTYIQAPLALEALLERCYGASGQPPAMAGFRAPAVSEEFLAFWGQARTPEKLDWPAISARFKRRSRWRHLLHLPWWWFNGAYILLISKLRRWARSV